MAELRDDWPDMRAAYVEGLQEDGRIHWPTLNEVATMYACHPASVRQRAAAESWTEQRATFQRRIEEERRAARAEEMARIGADLDIRVLRAAATGLGIAEGRLREFGMMSQARTAALRLREDNPATPIPPAPPSEEVATLAGTVARWYDLGNRALGDVPTQRLLVEGGRPIQVEHTALTPEERDTRTAGIIAVLVEAGAIPGDIFGNGHGGNGAGGNGHAVLDVGGPSALPGVESDAEDDEVHPDDPDEWEPER